MPVDYVVLDPSPLTLKIGQIMRFDVLAFDKFEQPLQVSGSAIFTSDIRAGRFTDPSVQFTAGRLPGFYEDAVQVEVRSRTGWRTATADVTVLRP